MTATERKPTMIRCACGTDWTQHPPPLETRRAQQGLTARAQSDEQGPGVLRVGVAPESGSERAYGGAA